MWIEHRPTTETMHNAACRQIHCDAARTGVHWDDRSADLPSTFDCEPVAMRYQADPPRPATIHRSPWRNPCGARPNSSSLQLRRNEKFHMDHEPCHGACPKESQHVLQYENVRCADR